MTLSMTWFNQLIAFWLSEALQTFSLPLMSALGDKTERKLAVGNAKRN